jgi:hypothetical protein
MSSTMSIEQTRVPMNAARAQLVAEQLLREARGLGGADELSCSRYESQQDDQDFAALVEVLTALLQGHEIAYDDGIDL